MTTLSVEEIAAIKDPVIRNLWITQRYHELAVQLRDGGMADDATWCAFAVWASKTAGATIRGDELPVTMRDLLVASDETKGALHRLNSGLEGYLLTRLEHAHLLDVVREVSDQVSDSIASGNRLVFCELAPLFTVMANGVASGTSAGRKAMSKELKAALAKVETEAAADDATGASVAAVRDAFAGYQRALDEPERRPTLVLAANILAVSHEQERLQPAITTALDAPLSDAFTAMVDREVTRHLPNEGLRAKVNTLVHHLGDVLDRTWQTALTAMMLRLNTSDESLELHRDVPPLNECRYPPMLSDLSGSPAEVPFNQWDRTGGIGVPTGANDWAIKEERMNYIVHLFRSRQRHPALFTPPFSAAQLDALAAGQLPEGDLSR